MARLTQERAKDLANVMCDKLGQVSDLNRSSKALLNLALDLLEIDDNRFALEKAELAEYMYVFQLEFS